MARKIIDLRTSDQKEGITSLQRTSELFAGILKTIGKGQQIKQNRRTLDRVTRAILAGATTPEAILAASQPTDPQFSPGGRGILQRIGGAFQPQGGGVGENIQSTILASLLKRSLTPKVTTQGQPSPGTFSQTDPTTGKTTILQQPKTVQSDVFTFKDSKGRTQKKRVKRSEQDKFFKDVIDQGGGFDTAAGNTDESKLRQWQTVFNNTLEKDNFTGEVIGTKPGMDKTRSLAEKRIQVLTDKLIKAGKPPKRQADSDFQKIGEDIAGVTDTLNAIRGQDLDEATARQILQEAGDDKDRARQIAQERGFNL